MLTTSVPKNLTHNIPTERIMKPQTKPRLEDVLDLLRDYSTYYRTFHANCATEDSYYFQNRPIPVPDDMPIDPVIPGTAPAIINVATAHVDVNNVSIDVPLSSPRAKARAERIKKFYEGAWLNIKDPVKQDAVKHAFTYGIGFVRQGWATENWPDAPMMNSFGDPDNKADFNTEGYRNALAEWMDKRHISFPFVLRNVLPQNLIWDDSRTGPHWVIETYQAPSWRIRQRYPEWNSNKNDSGMAQWSEYWDSVWYGYIADNEWVWGPFKHGYGFMPYRSINPSQSMSHSEGVPEDRYRGILRPVHSLLDEQARLYTAMAAIVRKYAWKTIDITGPRSMAEDVADTYQLFGSYNVIPTGVRVDSSPELQMPPDLMVAIDRIETQIEEATFPNVVRGVRPTGVGSGFGISVLAGTGRLVFQPVASGMARMIENVNSGNAMLLENKARGAVTVHARSEIHNFDQTIKPDDIRGYYENFVDLKAEAPEEREREALLAANLFDRGLLSKYEAQRRAGVVNPLEEQFQQRLEKVLDALLATAIESGTIQQALEEFSQAGGQDVGNQFMPGVPQLQRPGERNIQQARVASQQGQPSVFPQGFGGIEAIGNRLGTPGGGAQGVPSGQTVR
jgi:hypothetical protein